MGAEGGSWGRWARWFEVLGPCAVRRPPPPHLAYSFSASHPPIFLLMWKISSAVPCPPFWPARLSWKLHPGWVGGREGCEQGRGDGDAGLCLSSCFCSCISSPHPCPKSSHHRCLGTRVSCQRSSSALSSLGSLSPSRVSLCPIALSTFSWISIPPAPTPASSGLATILSPARLGPHLLQSPREAWPGHAHLSTRQQELELHSS